MLPGNSLLKSFEIKINGSFDNVMYLKKSLKVINCNFNLGIDRDGPRHVASVLEFDFDSIEPKERTSSNKTSENKANVIVLDSNCPAPPQRRQSAASLAANAASFSASLAANAASFSASLAAIAASLSASRATA
ncbi:hypothetical protein V6N11_047360 [Hibiscus sabdariffa]|uniref:Uncharacterized protein n=1 Tax=Hibiscus sabdariffa TaxID=183260 RepID=A0ABR2NJZ8_9ROSI